MLFVNNNDNKTKEQNKIKNKVQVSNHKYNSNHVALTMCSYRDRFCVHELVSCQLTCGSQTRNLGKFKKPGILDLEKPGNKPGKNLVKTW